VPITESNRKGVEMSHYLYKLTPPRPTFADDMTATETSAMEEHFAYWQQLVEGGSVVAYGPVADPAGTYGIAIIQADDEQHVQTIGRSDPAVIHGAGTFEVFAMPATVLRDDTTRATSEP
jgi:uncharacterized protein YciI